MLVTQGQLGVVSWGHAFESCFLSFNFSSLLKTIQPLRHRDCVRILTDVAMWFQHSVLWQVRRHWKKGNWRARMPPSKRTYFQTQAVCFSHDRSWPLSGQLIPQTWGWKWAEASLIQLSPLRLGVNCYIVTRRNGHGRTQRLWLLALPSFTQLFDTGKSRAGNSCYQPGWWHSTYEFPGLNARRGNYSTTEQQGNHAASASDGSQTLLEVKGHSEGGNVRPCRRPLLWTTMPGS